MVSMDLQPQSLFHIENNTRLEPHRLFLTAPIGVEIPADGVWVYHMNSQKMEHVGTNIQLNITCLMLLMELKKHHFLTGW